MTPPGRVAIRDSERTTAEILEAAIELIETEGESGVRVHDLARNAGRTMGAIYHHFGSREGLIEAARALQFRGRMEADIAAIDEAVERSSRPREFVEELVGIMQAALSPARRRNRWTRVDVVGCARARPRLAAALGAEQSRIVGLAADAFRKARDKGLLRPDADVESIALLALQMPFAFVLADIDSSTPVHADRYARFTAAILEGMLPDEHSGDGRRRSVSGARARRR